MKAIIGILGMLALVLLVGCVAENSHEPAEVQYHPEYTYDVRVEVITGSTTSNVICNAKSGFMEKVAEFNHSFFESFNRETHFEIGYENNVAVQNRIRYWNLRESYPEFQETDQFKNMTADLEDWQKYIECKAKILTPENGWSIRIYDNGYEEIHNLNLFGHLAIRCHPIFEEFDEWREGNETDYSVRRIYDWECEYNYGFNDEWNDDFDWYITEAIEADMLDKIVRRWL